MPQPPDSLATSLATLKERMRTGMPDTKPGSPKTMPIPLESGPSGPPPRLPEPGPLLRKSINSSVTALLAGVRYQTRPPEGIDQTLSLSLLRHALDRVIDLMRPAEDDDIDATLRMFAMTIGISAPPDLAGYMLALADVSAGALKHGAVDLLKIHEYPRLPLPSELIKASRRHTAELDFWRGELTRAITLLEKQP